MANSFEARVIELRQLDMDLVRDRKEIFDSVLENLLSYQTHEDDWSKYVVQNESVPYARSIVDDGNGSYNVLILCWNPGTGSPIHNHGNSQCFVKILKGELTETKYHLPEDESGCEMTVKSGPTTFKENQVTYIADEEKEVHKMENRSCSHCVSLHVYIPAYRACKVYDVRTSHSEMREMKFQKDCRQKSRPKRKQRPTWNDLKSCSHYSDWAWNYQRSHWQCLAPEFM